MYQVAIDLAGPYPEDQCGMRYILVWVDRFSSYCVFRPLKSKQALETAAMILSNICDLGVPRQVTSDNGGEFVNAIMQQLAEMGAFKHVTTRRATIRKQMERLSDMYR